MGGIKDIANKRKDHPTTSVGDEALDYNVSPRGWKSQRHLDSIIGAVVVVVVVVTDCHC